LMRTCWQAATSHGLGLVCFAVAAGASQSGRGSGAASAGAITPRDVRISIVKTADFADRDDVASRAA
jgi:hypothetical protein